MLDISDYLAAALVQTASEKEGGIAVPREQLAILIKDRYGLELSDEDISGAVRILNRCDISYSENDQFAGTFVVITAQRFNTFISRVNDEQKRYNDTLESDVDYNSSMNRAESLHLPYLEAYNSFSALRKYAQFGSDWIELAISRINEQSNLTRVPASDRIVAVDDNDPKANEIVSLAEDLENKLTVGNDVGDITAEQAVAVASEVSQLRASFSSRYLRREEVLRRARATLAWIGERAAGTAIGETAKTHYKLV